MRAAWKPNGVIGFGLRMGAAPRKLSVLEAGKTMEEMMQLLRSVFPVEVGKKPRRGLTPARRAGRQGFVAGVCRAVLLVGLCASVSLFAQQNQYAAANITGQLSLTRVVNLSSASLTTEEAPISNVPNLTEFSRLPSQFLPPPSPQNA